VRRILATRTPGSCVYMRRRSGVPVLDRREGRRSVSPGIAGRLRASVVFGPVQTALGDRHSITQVATL
jgi:hypothetical protein